jgi:hypothetical protein
MESVVGQETFDSQERVLKMEVSWEAFDSQKRDLAMHGRGQEAVDQSGLTPPSDYGASHPRAISLYSGESD